MRGPAAAAGRAFLDAGPPARAGAAGELAVRRGAAIAAADDGADAALGVDGAEQRAVGGVEAAVDDADVEVVAAVAATRERLDRHLPAAIERHRRPRRAGRREGEGGKRSACCGQPEVTDEGGGTRGDSGFGHRTDPWLRARRSFLSLSRCKAPKSSKAK